MHVKLLVEVELAHVSGKFASRNDLVDTLIAEITDPGQIDSDDGAEYSVEVFEVSEAPEAVSLPKGKLIPAVDLVKVKLANALVHMIEARSDGGIGMDEVAAQGVLSADVRAYIDTLGALLCARRDGKHPLDFGGG